MIVHPVETLPHFIICPHCGEKHFLTVNRDVYGQWSIGYVEYADGTILEPLGLNNSTNLNEAAHRMAAALQRYNRRNNPPHKEKTPS